jgi:hypothetical protein
MPRMLDIIFGLCKNILVVDFKEWWALEREVSTFFTSNTIE